MMSHNIFPDFLTSKKLGNYGASMREILLEEMQKSFDAGDKDRCVFFQTRYMFDSIQQLYFVDTNIPVEKLKEETIKNIIEHVKGNSLDLNSELTKHALKKLGDDPKIKFHLTPWERKELSAQTCDFLHDVVDTGEGLRKIMSVCKELPEEWTVLQLSKGPNPQTTCLLSQENLKTDSWIYVTLLKHIRSEDYPRPICIKLNTKDLDFKEDKNGNKSPNTKGKENNAGIFSDLLELQTESRTCMEFVKDPNSDMQKQKKIYWENMAKLDDRIKTRIEELKKCIFPWSFLFTGKPLANYIGSFQSSAFQTVDKFCKKHKLDDEQRILLSLAALNAHKLQTEEIDSICNILMKSLKLQYLAKSLLEELHKEASSILEKNSKSSRAAKHLPLILIVSERLDYFFWEEINTSQEMTRFNSLQAAYRLYKAHKDQIEHGYYKVNVTDGALNINPDGNLPKMEKRLKSFCEHWVPKNKWVIKASQKPSNEEIFKDFLKRKCYVYAGHGSGLQHVTGSNISKETVNAVVFLFGCESLCMNSMGLHSDFKGSHIYYQAAYCPTIIGTLLPALDATMDIMCCHLLSHWIPSKSKNIIPLNEIDVKLWTNDGIIKQKKSIKNVQKSKPEASLCSLLTQIHQRKIDKCFYNTVPYICRGLPAWNCDVQPISSIFKD